MKKLIDYKARAQKAERDLLRGSITFTRYNTIRKSIMRQSQRIRKAGNAVEANRLSQIAHQMSTPATVAKTKGKEIIRHALRKLEHSAKTLARVGNAAESKRVKGLLTEYKGQLKNSSLEYALQIAANIRSTTKSDSAIIADHNKLMADMHQDGLDGTPKELYGLNDVAKENVKALLTRYHALGGFQVASIADQMKASAVQYSKRMQEVLNIANQYPYDSEERKAIFEILSENKVEYRDRDTGKMTTTIKRTALEEIIKRFGGAL